MTECPADNEVFNKLENNINYKMRLNDVLTIFSLSLVSELINFPKAYSTLSSECPGQDVPTIRRRADQTELSFIFYYVSWCHDSITAKRVYDEVAQQYYDQANFAAVNCWHMECNCSYTYPAALGAKRGYPHKWPTLVIRYGRRMFLQYTDEWKFASLSRFIKNLYQPVDRLHGKDELKALTVRSNAVVLGLFPNASVSEYHKFTFAAVKWLESDPERLLRFAVGLGAIAEDIVQNFGTSIPIIILLSDKQLQFFKLSTKWTITNIVLWLQGEIKRIKTHFYGFSTPLTLTENVRKGAALTIFVNEIENPNDNFYLHMKRVLQSFGFVTPAKPTQNQCEQFWNIEENDMAKQIYAMTLKKEFNKAESTKNSCQAKPFLNCAYTPYNELRQQYVKAFLMRIQPNAQQQADDPYSAENLSQLYKYNECLQLTGSEGTAELQVIIAKLLMKIIQKIALDAIGTNNNRTMSVHMMDALKYQGLMRQHGLVNFEKPPTTTVIIIEPSQEGIYIMRKPLRYELLLSFIKEYYDGSLQITRRSSLVSLPEMSPPPPQNYDKQLNEFNRHKFLDGIQHNWRNTTTVLLLYSPRCAISWQMSHALLQVSAMFERSRNHNHHINIVRLNTQTNDLPWEFVMNTVPTLIVFPRGHSDESRIFPSHMKIDARNIFGFILAQFEPLEQVHVALESCALPTHHLLKCLQFVKTLAMQHISEHLRLWQRFASDRTDIVARLKLFKDITLNIQTSFPL